MFPFDRFTSWSPERGRDRIGSGKLPRRMRVAGHLALANSDWLTQLPSVLQADTIDLSNCRNLCSLPQQVTCAELNLARTGIVRLGSGLCVSGHIDATECRRLEF